MRVEAGAQHSALRQLRAAPEAHQRVAAALVRALAVMDPYGQTVARVRDVTQLADLAAQQVLDASQSWLEHLGPFYDGEAVRRLLGTALKPVTRQAVHKRKGLLALTTGSGQVVYPCAQFRGRQPAPGLAEVLAVLPEDLVSPWTLASWLLTPEVELDGQAPMQVLFDGGPEGHVAVLTAARHWAAALGG